MEDLWRGIFLYSSGSVCLSVFERESKSPHRTLHSSTLRITHTQTPKTHPPVPAATLSTPSAAMGCQQQLVVAVALASALLLVKESDACSCVFGKSLCDQVDEASIVLRGTVSDR